ncbi:polysaccharide pyruvyl transferase family protein [Vibrio cholerae]
MNNVGIINFHYSDHNYGAVLQAVALQHLVEKIGLHAEHIDYVPIPSKVSLCASIKSFAIDLVKSIDTTGVIVNTPKVFNKDIFESFRKQYMNRSSDIYRKPDDLIKIGNKYSHVIVGSDQVWRPSYTVENRDVYFLNFCRSETKRISYAASFGVDYWELKHNPAETQKVAEEIGKFHAISVRESSGVQICDEIFDVYADHVLDPTLAIGRDFFDEIADEAKNLSTTMDNIVYYKLDPDNKFLDFLNYLESSLNTESENIYRKKIGKKYFYNEVSEWLAKIRNSKLVVTDSFHCICFAILFEKEFFYVPNNSRGVTRLESLLSSLGLSNRIAKNNLKDFFIECYQNKIDYNKVNDILKNKRETSISFLYNSLQ